MKKSKLTGALAVGGGLKHAVVPYIITGEENNGYSKGDILDANYVKQLINNNTIPDDIQANTLTLNDTLTLNGGRIETNNYFAIYDKKTPQQNMLDVSQDGFSCYQQGIKHTYASKDYYEINSNRLTITSPYNLGTTLNATLYYINLTINNSLFYIDGGQAEFPTGLILYKDDRFAFTRNTGWGPGDGIYLNPSNITIAGSNLRMGNNTSGLIQYYSKDGSGNFKGGDVAFYWKDGILFLNKIYKPTQTTSEKDLFERVSDLETPKTTREDNPKVGQCVFDTTLGKPIWCKTAKTDTTAAVWVDATGTTV